LLVENYFADKKILISGGLGFIGSHLARRLVGFGANVTVIDSLIPEYGGNYHNVFGLEGKLNINISQYKIRAMDMNLTSLGSRATRRLPYGSPAD
jgi:nucleoside-diphosphate-sugar epimerase